MPRRKTVSIVRQKRNDAQYLERSRVMIEKADHLGNDTSTYQYCHGCLNKKGDAKTNGLLFPDEKPENHHQAIGEILRDENTERIQKSVSVGERKNETKKSLLKELHGH